MVNERDGIKGRFCHKDLWLWDVVVVMGEEDNEEEDVFVANHKRQSKKDKRINGEGEKENTSKSFAQSHSEWHHTIPILAPLQILDPSSHRHFVRVGRTQS